MFEGAQAYFERHQLPEGHRTILAINGGLGSMMRATSSSPYRYHYADAPNALTAAVITFLQPLIRAALPRHLARTFGLRIYGATLRHRLPFSSRSRCLLWIDHAVMRR